MAGSINSTVTVRSIRSEDAHRVGVFLQSQLNPRVPVTAWEALIFPPWPALGPNHGFQLVDAHGELVGVYVAVYSARNADDLAVCNLAAFCVLEAHRTHSLRLVRELLRQKGYLFTDFSPSGNVPAMNERLGFHHLDVSTRLVLNRPRPSVRCKVTEDPATIASVLDVTDAGIYQDHRLAPAARHALVQSGSDYAYLVYRRDRRKHLPLFASPLYVGGDVELLEAAWPTLSGHLFGRGLLATLAERRVLGFSPAGPGRELDHPRPKMYRGDVASDSVVDYLYSELTLLQW